MNSSLDLLLRRTPATVRAGWSLAIHEFHPHLERRAVDDSYDKRRKTVVVAAASRAMPRTTGISVIRQAAAERVGHQLSRSWCGRTAPGRCSKALRSSTGPLIFVPSAVGRRRRSGFRRCRLPWCAMRRWRRNFPARSRCGSITCGSWRRGGLARCSFHALAHRQHPARLRVAFIERRNIGRRWRRRRAEHIVQHPFAAQHRRSAVGVGGHREDAALAQQSPRASSVMRHAAELAAIDVRNSVVLGQALIDEGVIGVQQIEHAVVFAHDAAEEHLGLALESLPQVVVEIGENQAGPDSWSRRLRRYSHWPTKLSISASDAVVGQHALHLLLQDRRVLEFALARRP